MPRILIALLMILPLSPAAFARGPVDELKAAIQNVQRHCGPEFCRAGFEYKLVVEGHRSSLPDPVARALAMHAKSQAQIWGDTILEGDYEAKGDTRIDRVFAVRGGGRLVAYRVFFSETARSPEGPGRIVEAVWVHPNLKTALGDESMTATFQSL